MPSSSFSQPSPPPSTSTGTTKCHITAKIIITTIVTVHRDLLIMITSMITITRYWDLFTIVKVKLTSHHKETPMDGSAEDIVPEVIFFLAISKMLIVDIRWFSSSLGSWGRRAWVWAATTTSGSPRSQRWRRRG